MHNLAFGRGIHRLDTQPCNHTCFLAGAYDAGADSAEEQGRAQAANMDVPGAIILGVLAVWVWWAQLP